MRRETLGRKDIQRRSSQAGRAGDEKLKCEGLGGVTREETYVGPHVTNHYRGFKSSPLEL